MIGGHQLESRTGHAIDRRLTGILHHGHTAPQLDGHQTQATIVERPGKHNPDDARAVGTCRRAEERINGWPGVVFPRPARQLNGASADQEVAIGWRHDDLSGPNRHPVSGVDGRKRTRPAQDLWEVTVRIRRHMHDDEERRRQIRRQTSNQVNQGRDTACGGANDHDIVVGHRWRLFAASLVLRFRDFHQRQPHGERRTFTKR